MAHSPNLLSNAPFAIETKSRAGTEPAARKPAGRVSGWGYRILLLSCDLSALCAAYLATLALRMTLNPLMQQQVSQTLLEGLLPPLPAILLLWFAAALRLGVYRPRNMVSFGQNLLEVAESVLITSTLTITVTFFSRQMGADLSRSFVLLFAPVSFVMLLGARYAAYFFAQRLGTRWSSVEKVAITGHGAEASQLAQQILAAGPAGTSLVGVIVPDRMAGHDDGRIAGTRIGSLPVLGTTRQLAQLINREGIDRIIMAGHGLTDLEYAECTRVTRRMGVAASHAIRTDGPTTRLSVNLGYGLPLVDLRTATFTKRQEMVKRALDILASGALLLMVLPLLVFFAILIKLDSAGPVLYRSTRVGKGGRHFTFLKFRSMVTNFDRQKLAAMNEKQGHIFKIRKDPRITRVGGFLRRYSLDELPQLLNVLFGEMSLVGPRPLPAADLDGDGMSEQFHFWAEQRALVPPGITGLWQVRGRSDLTFDQMVEFDTEYVRNWSLGLDLRVLLETPLAVLTGRGAY